jgi:hypothetical protein
VDAPGTVPESPFQYRFDYLCLIDNNNFDLACLAATAECNAGQNGRPVRWWWKLVVAGPNDWSRISPDRCVYLEKPEDVLAKIAAQIQAKFQQLPVSPGNAVMQPSPHTLRGAETNFYAEAVEQTFGVDMLGQRVSIVAKPVEFPVVLTTHFQGTYSVNGGPELPIPGQGQFSSPPQTISVWRSITRNYADTCLQNPQGQGCPGVAPPPP